MGMKKMERVLLTTGGTGGHIFPALAVAEALREENPQVQILFMGSEYGPEKELMAKAGIEFYGLAVRGFIGRGMKAFGASLAMLRALGQAKRKVASFQPDVAIGFGGYAAFAPLLAAKWSGVPTALHEQNAVVGVSNKVLGKLVDKVFLSMPLTTEKSFATEKTVLTGNPVRVAVAKIGQREHDFTGKRLLVVGGSLGAKALNDVVVTHIEELLAQGICVRHQVGSRDLMRIHEAYAAKGIVADFATAFVDDMAEAYDWADVVLCRSGATTVAELAAAGRGAVFVPFPHATHDHQAYNARLLADHGAAKVYAEKDMHAQNMMGEVIRLLQTPEELEKMSLAAKAQSRIYAAQDIVIELEKLAQR